MRDPLHEATMLLAERSILIRNNDAQDEILRVDREIVRVLDEARASMPAENGRAGWGASADCPTVAELVARNLPGRRWILDGWLQERKTMLLFGTSYTGKSLLGYQAALAIARGEGDILGHRVAGPAREVLVFMGENDEVELRDTVAVQLGDTVAPPTLRYCDVFAQKARHTLASAEGLSWFRSVVAAHRTEVAVLDNLMSLSGADLKDSEAAQFVMEGLKRISKELGTSWIVLAHTRKEGSKGDDASPADRLYGAHEWLSFADSAVYIGFEKEDRESGRRQVHTIKVRGARPAAAQVIELDEDTLTARHVAELGRKSAVSADTVDRAVRAIRDAGTMLTREEIAEAVGCSSRTVRRLVTELEARAEAGEIDVAVRNRQGGATAFKARSES